MASNVTTLIHFEPLPMSGLFSMTYPAKEYLFSEFSGHQNNFEEKYIYIIFPVHLPVSSEPPVLAGGDQLSVTLLLVIFVVWKFSGQDGGAVISHDGQ